MEGSNPAVREIYIVDYHVILNEEVGGRLNGNFEYEGSLPSRENLLPAITGRHPDLDWNTVHRITYSVSRLMNNNTHILEEQGEFSSQELSGSSGH